MPFLLRIRFGNRTLYDSGLTEKSFQTRLSSLSSLKFLYRVSHSIFVKTFLSTKKFFQSLFIDVFLPFQFIFICNMGFVEQFSCFYERKLSLVWNDVASFTLSFIFFFAISNDIFYGVEILDKFVCFDRPNSFNFGRIVASAKNAHINEFFICQLQTFHHGLPCNFSQRFFFVVHISDHSCCSKH